MPTNLEGIFVPDTLAAFPVDAVASMVANASFEQLDESWRTPADETGARHLRPDFDFSAHGRSFMSWLARGGNRSLFQAEIAAALRASVADMEAMMAPGRKLRLLAAAAAQEDPAPALARDGLPPDQEAAQGGPWGAWTRDLDRTVTPGAPQAHGEPPAKVWAVVAEWDEAAVDWANTMLLRCGFGDFEKEVVLKPGAVPSAIVSSTPRASSRVELPAGACLDGKVLQELFRLGEEPALYEATKDDEVWSAGPDACIRVMHMNRGTSVFFVAAPAAHHFADQVERSEGRNLPFLPKGTTVTPELVQQHAGLPSLPTLFAQDVVRGRALQVWAVEGPRSVVTRQDAGRVTCWMPGMPAKRFAEWNDIPRV